MTTPEVENLFVLAVDDEPYNLRLISSILKQIGIQKVLTASSGSDALDILETTRNIDLIISDLEMPEMNGFEFVEQVRTRSNLNASETPVLILTSHSDPSSIKQAVGLGINGYMAKPVSPESLKKRIMKAIGGTFIRPDLVNIQN